MNICKCCAKPSYENDDDSYSEEYQDEKYKDETSGEEQSEDNSHSDGEENSDESYSGSDESDCEDRYPYLNEEDYDHSSKYYEGLSKEEIEVVKNLSPEETMIFDLKRGIRVGVEFYPGEDLAMNLQKFIENYPEFQVFFEPMLERNYGKYELVFEKFLDRLIISLLWNNLPVPTNYPIEMTVESFSKLVYLVSPFTILTTEGGDYVLGGGSWD